MSAGLLEFGPCPALLELVGSEHLWENATFWGRVDCPFRLDRCRGNSAGWCHHAGQTTCMLDAGKSTGMYLCTLDYVCMEVHRCVRNRIYLCVCMHACMYVQVWVKSQKRLTEVEKK